MGHLGELPRPHIGAPPPMKPNPFAPPPSMGRKHTPGEPAQFLSCLPRKFFLSPFLLGKGAPPHSDSGASSLCSAHRCLEKLILNGHQLIQPPWDEPVQEGRDERSPQTRAASSSAERGAEVRHLLQVRAGVWVISAKHVLWTSGGISRVDPGMRAVDPLGREQRRAG